MSANRKSSRKPAPKKSGGGVFVGIVIGLMLGAIFAAGVAWYLTRNNPFAGQETREARGDEPLAPRVLPGKPGDRPVEQPQFDFYKILPKGDGAVDVTAKGAAPVAEAAPAAERLYLQVGAFEDPTEADNLKARLALMGIEASVQRGESTRGTVHRVRLGPYARLDDMNPVRADLARAGIESHLVRVKP